MTDVSHLRHWVIVQNETDIITNKITIAIFLVQRSFKSKALMASRALAKAQLLLPPFCLWPCRSLGLCRIVFGLGSKNF